jgi:hypothetical protein
MHKTTMRRLIFFVVAICFFSCKKADHHNAERNNLALSDKLSTEVRAWLITQKSAHKLTENGKINPKNDATIDLLIENLIFDEATTEQVDMKNIYLTIPVKQPYLDKEKLDRNANLFLQLNIDTDGNINAGGLVYFFAADSRTHYKFPKNTFRNLFRGNQLNLMVSTKC